MIARMNRGLGLMRAIQEATRSYRREEDEKILQDQAITDLRASYSMQGERQILDEVVGQATALAGGLGDVEFANVELF